MVGIFRFNLNILFINGGDNPFTRKKRSTKKILKRSGPRTEPCGTPNDISDQEYNYHQSLSTSIFSLFSV